MAALRCGDAEAIYPSRMSGFSWFHVSTIVPAISFDHDDERETYPNRRSAFCRVAVAWVIDPAIWIDRDAEQAEICPNRSIVFV